MIRSLSAPHRFRGMSSAGSRLAGARDFRQTIHQSSLATVEDSSIAGDSSMPFGYEPVHQLVLPYFGLFAYAVGQRKWLVDTNKVLFISPGWDFRDEQPVAGLGHATIIVTPAKEVVQEICRSAPAENRSFPAGAVHSPPRLQMMTQSLLGRLSDGDSLGNDELVVEAMRFAINGAPVCGRPSAQTVDRAKQFLHAHDCERLTLDQVARAVGVSPIYLTQEFTRSEGIPLYQYQLSLRLARALVELPHSDNITGLALDLGFSSHSHFTLSFRKAFGVTPSQYRRSSMSRIAMAIPYSVPKRGPVAQVA